MGITPARKFLSYFVSFMLLCLGKFSYDYHNQRPHLPSQDSPFKVIVDSKILPPPTTPAAPTPPDKAVAPFVVIKDGKTVPPATSPTSDKSE